MVITMRIVRDGIGEIRLKYEYSKVKSQIVKITHKKDVYERNLY